MNDDQNPAATDGMVGATPSVNISVEMSDKHDLYAAYMPYLKNGGLFIPTRKTHYLGEDVSVTLELKEQEETIHIEGKVVWITPVHAQDNRRKPGVGIQFNMKDSGGVQKKIEAILAGMQTGNVTPQAM